MAANVLAHTWPAQSGQGAVYLNNGELCDAIGSLAYEAMVREVMVTPKPGLVDQANSGAHRDMDLALFLVSADAIAPWLSRFVHQGLASKDHPLDQLLGALRPLGVACEQAMITATGGVNTHKGMIFSMALVSGATGYLLAREGRQALTARRICQTVAAMTTGIVERELGTVTQARTAGERLYRDYGLTGVRGEVAAGLPTVYHHGLPVLRALLPRVPLDQALLQTLLHLMAHSDDSNIVSRGGLLGLEYVRRQATALLAQGGVFCRDGLAAIQRFDRDMIARNLSPGGSADLLAVTWLLYAIEKRVSV